MRVEHSIADHRKGEQSRANTDKRTQIRGQTRRHRQEDKDEKTQIRGQQT